MRYNDGVKVADTLREFAECIAVAVSVQQDYNSEERDFVHVNGDLEQVETVCSDCYYRIKFCFEAKTHPLKNGNQKGEVVCFEDICQAEKGDKDFKDHKDYLRRRFGRMIHHIFGEYRDLKGNLRANFVDGSLNVWLQKPYPPRDYRIN